MTPDEARALELLGYLERRESRLLAWGMVDFGFARDELREIAAAYAAEHPQEGAWPEDRALEWLEERRLLLEFDTPEGTIWRTRMAETVRLIARLRQLFPQHALAGAWRGAPTLVADFRFTLRPRLYPERTISTDAAIDYIAGATRVEADRRAILEGLLRTPGEVRRLARFQCAATAQILADLDGWKSRGVIVCAGTGSGKTLAFYLPALSHVAALVDASHWTKVLAIYPRNELLKDQFSETYREVRKLDPLLAATRRRKLVVGAYFGPTPWHSDRLDDAWTTVPGGRICPFLRCPACAGDLVWLEADRHGGRERLRCGSAGCAASVEADEVALTRRRMVETPPDVLFTTTEMLNRNLGDARTSHVFGVGPRVRRGPDLVLLDEVHTYAGASGAQAALLLRRWRHAVSRPVRFVGLSATLRDASRFFSRLTGLTENQVTLVEPGEGELVREGMEYLLAVRGDPASGTSLLATTIQTLMLLRRMLDRPPGRAGGACGSKVFAFTDNLDVLNRLYFDLLDAEGRDSFGRALGGRNALASIRARGTIQPSAAALAAGQRWDACQEVGHSLTALDRLRVERTSSQDAGVDRQADIVVATATLEVGFNDPEVGAVLQHKAPRDSAPFLQRKGRAGRRREMRPWTVVTLSDYGRDRLAYQGYDLLFDPALAPRHLPIANRHVLRMQAAQALMDWLAEAARGAGPGSIWADLAGPTAEHYRTQGTQLAAEARRRVLIARLESLLDADGTRADLQRFLGRALQVSEDEALALLWEPPRALLTAVVPTVLRRLRSDWRSIAPGGITDRWIRGQPLPEFMPPNLFSDLDLPEVTVTVPPAQQGEPPGEHPMPIAQALFEYAPGRVSKRFGVAHRFVRHWVAPLLQSGPQFLDVQAFCGRAQRIGSVQVRDGDAIHDLDLLRPTEFVTATPPQSVADSSNAELLWRSQLWPLDGGQSVDLPVRTAWGEVLEEVRFFTHAARSGVEVRRFASGASANIQMRGGQALETAITFIEGACPQPVAVGFAFRADGFSVRFRLPAELDLGDGNLPKVRALRAEAFRQRVLTAQALDGVANVFQRGWLHQIYASALLTLAIQEGLTLEGASARLQVDAHLVPALSQVLSALFQTLPQAGGSPAALQRVHLSLAAMLSDSVVVETLRASSRVLWEAPDEVLAAFARSRCRATLAAALAQACEALCPDFAADTLLVDLDPGPRPPGAPSGSPDEVWFTENSPGGGGIIEELARRVADDPRRFLRLCEAALHPSDFVVADRELQRILAWAEHDPDMQARLERVRAATRNDERHRAFEALSRALASRGATMSHSVTTALSTRVLRPGSSPETDDLLRRVLRRWLADEERLGVDIDARVFAYACGQDGSLDGALATIGDAPDGDLLRWRYTTVYSLLWPRGGHVRAQSLAFQNRYAPPPATDSELLRGVLRPPAPGVRLARADWSDELARLLREGGQATLVAPAASRTELRRAVLELLAEPVEVGALHVHPRVVGLTDAGGDIAVTFELRETLP